LLQFNAGAIERSICVTAQRDRHQIIYNGITFASAIGTN
jgi:hypothetical protein